MHPVTLPVQAVRAALLGIALLLAFPAPVTAAGSPTPDPATTGFYLNGPNCHFGHYRLQRTDARVSLELTSFVASAACLEHTPARAMFVLPPAYRPPMTIVREVAVAPGPRFLVPETVCRAGCRLRLRVAPDGRVHYERATPSFHADQLSELRPRVMWSREEVRVLTEQLSEMREYTDWGWGVTPKGEFTLSVQWGTTPADNDQVVLAILDEHWFGRPLLARMPLATREPPAITEPGLCRVLALNPEGRVTELRLQEQHLRGAPLPPELGQLTGLECLHLELFSDGVSLESDGMDWEWPLVGVPRKLPPDGVPLYDLFGPIPPELGQLRQLRVLRLANNLLFGPIPPELGQLRQLRVLRLANNLLEAPIPPELGQLRQSLETLDLSWNLLTGPLPDALGQLRNLQSLHLQANGFTGSLPPTWGQLTNLTELDLYFNPLTGSLPPAWAQLRQLQTLHLGYNGLTGSLPPAWGQLANLTELDLYFNHLTGSLPPHGVNWPTWRVSSWVSTT